MSDLTDLYPEQLKEALCRNGVWNQHSFTHIVASMFYCRPSRWLYLNMSIADHMVKTYTQLINICDEYADANDYPWIKTKLKDIIWVDFKEFYDTLARLVRDNTKKIPFDEHDKNLINTLVALWIQVSAFPDERDSSLFADNTNNMQISKQPFRIPSTIYR